MKLKRPYTKLTAETYNILASSSKDLSPNPWALSEVRYASVKRKRMLDLVFSDFSVGVPLLDIQELAEASVMDLKQLRLSPSGDTIISDRLDAHLSVEGLLKDLSITSPIFSQLVCTLFATRGGKISTERKRKTSAENGLKGGRPRKVDEHALA